MPPVLSSTWRCCQGRVPQILAWLPQWKPFTSTTRYLRGNMWGIPRSKDEKDLLASMRAARKSWSEIEEAFPNRTGGAIRTAYYSRGPRDDQGHLVHLAPGRWTRDECSKLYSLRQSGLGFVQIVREHFPGKGSVEARAVYEEYAANGYPLPPAKQRKWDSTEEGRLIHLREEGYPRSQIAEILGRTHRAITGRLCKIAPRGVPKYAPYTTVEDELIVQIHQRKGLPTDYQAALPTRKWSSIRDRLKVLRCRPHEMPDWQPKRTTQQVLDIRQQAAQLQQQGLKRAEIAKALEVSPRALSCHMSKGKRRDAKLAANKSPGGESSADPPSSLTTTLDADHSSAR